MPVADGRQASLGRDEVHVWRLDVDGDQRRSDLRADWRTNVLACYAGRPPAALRFRRHPSGSIVLDEPAGLTFSISHARQLSLLAVGRRPLGIDVEPLSAAAQIEEIADSYLPREPVTRIRSLPRSLREEAWVRLWTELE